jgi:hypothetical protein
LRNAQKTGWHRYRPPVGDKSLVVSLHKGLGVLTCFGPEAGKLGPCQSAAYSKIDSDFGPQPNNDGRQQLFIQ